MTALQQLAPSRDHPTDRVLRYALAALLLCDAILILLLPHATWVVALVAVCMAGLAIASRLHWTIATIAVGYPLLDPVSVAIHTEAPAFFALRLCLVGGVGWFFFARVQGPGRSALRAVSDPVVLWAVALGAVVGLGLLESPSPGYGRMKLVSYLATSLPLLFAGFFLAMGHKREDRECSDRRQDALYGAFVVLATLIAAAGLANLLFRFQPFETRLTVLGLNPIWLARIMGLGLLALLALWDIGRTRPAPFLRPLPMLLVALLLGVVMVFAGSRGPLLGLLLILALRGLVLTRVPLRRRISRIAAGTIAACALFLLMPEEVRDRFLHPVHQDVSGVVRLRLIEVAREALGFVTGWGAGTGAFSDLMKMGDHRFYPHNLIAEIGIENGLPGLVILLLFLITVAVRGLRRRTDTRVLAATLCFLFAFWNAQVSGDLMANEWIWLFAGLIAGRTR
jgi:hypothetical protein